MQVFNLGKMTVFGHVAVNKSGLGIGERLHPWHEIHKVVILEGELKVTSKDGGWVEGVSVPVEMISNLDVLINTIEQVMALETVEK